MTKQRPDYLRERQAVEGRRAGKTSAQIAKETGWSYAAVSERYRRGLAHIFHANIPELADLAPLRPLERRLIERTLKLWPNYPATLIAGVPRRRLPRANKF